jgi:deazaflavin-dependent oxidoreductase (nitroreductase family)
MSELNDQVIAEFRANAGVVREAMGGHFKDIHLLLLHNVGIRSGKTYVNPVLYQNEGDGFIVGGSNGGLTDTQPQWVANVAAMPETTIEVGERTLKVKPTVLYEGQERDRLYAALVAYWPDFLEYETHTSRQFPVIRLDPME